MALPNRLRPHHRQIGCRRIILAMMPMKRVDLGHVFGQLTVVRPIPGLIKAITSVKVPVIQVGQKQNAPTVPRLPIRTGDKRGRKGTFRIAVAGDRQRKRFEISQIRGAPGFSPCQVDSLEKVPQTRTKQNSTQDHCEQASAGSRIREADPRHGYLLSLTGAVILPSQSWWQTIMPLVGTNPEHPLELLGLVFL